MTVYQIIEAKPYHCGQILRRMRVEHREAVAKAQYNLHRELQARFYESYLCRAWLIDGRLAALGGVSGGTLTSTGFVWLVLSEEATRHPIAIIKEARRQLREIMATKQELAILVLDGDAAARRLAIFLGFHVSHEGAGSPAFTRYERRALTRFIETAPRIPVGQSYAVGMGLHG